MASYAEMLIESARNDYAEFNDKMEYISENSNLLFIDEKTNLFKTDVSTPFKGEFSHTKLHVSKRVLNDGVDPEKAAKYIQSNILPYVKQVLIYQANQNIIRALKDKTLASNIKHVKNIKLTKKLLTSKNETEPYNIYITASVNTGRLEIMYYGNIVNNNFKFNLAYATVTTTTYS